MTPQEKVKAFIYNNCSKEYEKLQCGMKHNFYAWEALREEWEEFEKGTDNDKD